MPTRCPSCGAESPSIARFCPLCAAPLAPARSADPPSSGNSPTISTPAILAVDGKTMAGAAAGSPALRIRTSSAPASPAASEALPPGVLVAGRYRIVALLGRGGMGEVYRADDLKLGQAVALKFLPRAVERDPSRLERFLNEVRIAREVSHPNVCRVHDVGEVDGRHFLSMEYIDGEDLASLLRRIGRLPSDKALDIARQLCAGLAAAHDRGVLHRDLKPANVMLDGRGHVRLTDFGLAETAGAEGSAALAGTPAYMAPEQFKGQPASVLTDIYALGLVLYEIFTGRRVFEAETIADLRRLHDESRPPSLTSVIRDSDPIVERVIHRCLEKDPKQRPASAIAVAAALPGGDPLAAALAAGETPSPAMVAAAGETRGLRSGVAAAWFAAIVAALLAVTYFATRTSAVEAVPKPFSQDVLAVKAQEMLGRLGQGDPQADSASAFEWDGDYFQFAAGHRTAAAAAISTGHGAVWFWFRTSPTWLLSEAWDSSSFGAILKVRWTDPPRELAGMRSLALDPLGRLLALEVVPPAVETSPAPASPLPVDWRAALTETGVDPASLSPATPSWTPPAWADARMAWTARYPDLPNVPLRVEAAAYRGKITFVHVVAPWTQPEHGIPPTPGTADRVAEAVQLAIVLSLLVGAMVVARRNAALGRGDLRGARRVAGAIALIFAFRWLFGTHHVGDTGEGILLFKGLGATCLIAAWMWMLYVGLEPFVRRRWPHALIGWSRLLMGRVTDPLVGRDVLSGISAGLILAAVAVLKALTLNAMAGDFVFHRFPLLSAFTGVRGIADLFGFVLYQAILNALGLMFLLFLLRMALRRDWLMAAAFVVLMSARVAGGDVGTAAAGLAFQVAWSLVMVYVLARHGLLAFAVAWTVDRVVELTPMTTALGAWHAGPTVAGVVAVVALAAFATRVALAGRSLLGAEIHGE